MMKMNKRAALGRIGAIVAAATLFHGPAAAQSVPRQVRLVVPFAAGGPADLIARKVAERLGPELGSTVIVDNRPGANGAIAVQAVSKGAPDGSMLLFATSGMLTISPVLYKQLNYDPLKDLAPVARLVVNGTAFLVGKGIPAADMKEFVAYARASAKPVAIGSAGIGNITHLYVELLKDATRTELLHVPYKGVSPALSDVMGGQIAGVFVDLPAALPLLESGRVKALGVVGRERSPSAPDIATIHEQGFEGVDGASWFGVMASPKLSADLTGVIHRALATVMKQPAMIAELKQIGSVASVNTPQQMRELIVADQARWKGLIEARKIEAD